MFGFQRAATSFAVLAVFGVLTACNGDPLKGFVAQDVKLSVKQSGGQVTATGKLNFTKVYYTTSYHTVCDYYECGGYEDVCTGGGTYCSGGREVCSGGGEVCTEVQRCTGAGCTSDTVCRTTSGSCYTVGETCHTEPRDCRREYVSRSCSTNCRREPRYDRHEAKVPSVVTVNVKGADAKAIQALNLSVKPGYRFIEAFENASIRPKGYEHLWDTLSKEDKTVLIAGSKGVKLQHGQKFLVLPQGFKPGDPVTIEALFEPSGSAEAKASAVGTNVDFPELTFEQK